MKTEKAGGSHLVSAGELEDALEERPFEARKEQGVQALRRFAAKGFIDEAADDPLDLFS